MRAGRGFRYLGPDGGPGRDDRTLERIRSLAVPPAWTDVWICADERGHLQATGRDARGRKVYRYHPRFRQRRESDKYARLADFGRVLPRIRRAVERDLRRQGMPQDKVLALVVRLLELTYMRVGNESYAVTNRSFGITTLRSRHATVTGTTVRFRFRGKSGKVHQLRLRDRRLARLVGRCQDLPGQTLFTWLDEDERAHPVTSEDVNDYLRRVSGADVTARDFRTWAGSVLALRALRAVGEPGTSSQRPRQVAAAMGLVADGLGNTRTVARGSYVHPAVVDAWNAGRLPAAGRSADADGPPTRAEERELLRLVSAASRRYPRRTKSAPPAEGP